MSKNFFFPIMLSLKGKKCLVIGAGKVGLRKLAKLLQARPGEALVLDTHINEKFLAFASSRMAKDIVKFEKRAYTQKDLTRSFIVFAATSDDAVNGDIARECEKLNVLCNCASSPELGSFIMPASALINDVSIMISTNGASPAFARKWLAEQKARLEGRKIFLDFMKNLRRIISASKASFNHEDLYYKIIASPLEEWLKTGERDKCADWLIRELPVELRSHIKEVLDDIS